MTIGGTFTTQTFATATRAEHPEERWGEEEGCLTHAQGTRRVGSHLRVIALLVRATKRGLKLKPSAGRNQTGENRRAPSPANINTHTQTNKRGADEGAEIVGSERENGERSAPSTWQQRPTSAA